MTCLNRRAAADLRQARASLSESLRGRVRVWGPARQCFSLAAPAPAVPLLRGQGAVQRHPHFHRGLRVDDGLRQLLLLLRPPGLLVGPLLPGAPPTFRSPLLSFRLLFRPCPPATPSGLPSQPRLPASPTLPFGLSFRLLLPVFPSGFSFRPLLPASHSGLSFRPLLPASPSGLSFRHVLSASPSGLALRP